MNQVKSPRDVVIVGAARTAVGRGKRPSGVYSDVHPSTLLAHVYGAVLERAGVDAGQVGEVITGAVTQVGEQSNNIGRLAWLQAGYPVEVPATTVDMQCGSSQQAFHLAAAQIKAGFLDIALAAGVEHMGRVPMGSNVPADLSSLPYTPELLERYALTPQGLSAELIAERWQLSRAELDEFGVRSQTLAAAAADAGVFDREIAPVIVNGEPVLRDQGIRPGTNLEALAALKPAFKPDGVVTAATSSQLSDGAAAVLLASRETAERLGLPIRAEIVDQLVVGVDPVIMLTGPIPATQQILERNGLVIGDIDRVEINEAFAPVVVAWGRELDPDWSRVNVNGGALALGHPLGSSGARLITTLVHELERSDSELGLSTMCTAGGLGTATLIRRV
ncbi:MAG: thiolase family protein [Solirubrobacteraceae bacterium]|nr:thiolase family protein [Solirubrobacteraceae bacterium]